MIHVLYFTYGIRVMEQVGKCCNFDHNIHGCDRNIPWICFVTFITSITSMDVVITSKEVVTTSIAMKVMTYNYIHCSLIISLTFH